MIVDYVMNDIWRIRLKDLPRKKSLLIKYLRIGILTVKGFFEDKCTLQASALTFYSLLSVVPVAAMLFGIAKGFGMEKRLEAILHEELSGHEEVLEKVMVFSQSLLQKAQGGVIAGIGVAVLFYTVLKLFSNIEHSFNDIWGVKENRSLVRKLGIYPSTMLVCPFLFIISTSVTGYISSGLASISNYAGFINPVTNLFLSIIPYGVMWVLFTFIYILMPNTKVHFFSGMIAGIIAGTFYQLLQMFYIHIQVWAGSAGAIYGSFAALPLFLFWLQLSWFIVLFGAEISFAHQNVDTYEFEPDSLRISYKLKKLLTLRIMNLIIKSFDVTLKFVELFFKFIHNLFGAFGLN